jgi:hypothetical protein
MKREWITLFLLWGLSACDSTSSDLALNSTKSIEGLWQLKSVSGTELPENQTAVLIIISEESAGVRANEACSGATVAEYMAASQELALVEESVASEQTERCFVSLPINESAQLSLQAQVQAGVRAELQGSQLILTNLRGESYILGR